MRTLPPTQSPPSAPIAADNLPPTSQLPVLDLPPEPAAGRVGLLRRLGPALALTGVAIGSLALFDRGGSKLALPDVPPTTAPPATAPPATASTTAAAVPTTPTTARPQPTTTAAPGGPTTTGRSPASSVPATTTTVHPPTTTPPTTTPPTTAPVPPTTAAPASPAACTGSERQGPVVSTRWGPVQVVAVVSAQGHICSVNAVQTPSDHFRSVNINQRAVPVLNQLVLAAQSAKIDNVSGATVTTNAYRQSLQAILDSVGR